jgi:hypothetical protein
LGLSRPQGASLVIWALTDIGRTEIRVSLVKQRGRIERFHFYFLDIWFLIKVEQNGSVFIWKFTIRASFTTLFLRDFHFLRASLGTLLS